MGKRHSPLPRLLPQWEEDIPSQHPTCFGAFGASILPLWCSTSAHSAPHPSLSFCNVGISAHKRSIYCMFFVLFLSTISRHPTARFTPNFACGRTLVPDVSSPLLEVSGPRGAERGGNEIFVTIGVNGEFLHFGGF